MDFPGVEEVLPQNITILSARDIARTPKYGDVSFVYQYTGSLQLLSKVINDIGIASAVAQGLRHPVTTLQRVLQNPEHRLYVLRGSGHTVLGFLKVGRKKLFVMVQADLIQSPDMSSGPRVPAARD